MRTGKQSAELVEYIVSQIRASRRGLGDKKLIERLCEENEIKKSHILSVLKAELRTKF